MSVFLAMCTHSSVGEQLLTLAFSASLFRTREQTPLARFGDLLVCLVFSSGAGDLFCEDWLGVPTYFQHPQSHYCP